MKCHMIHNGSTHKNSSSKELTCSFVLTLNALNQFVQNNLTPILFNHNGISLKQNKHIFFFISDETKCQQYINSIITISTKTDLHKMKSKVYQDQQ